jgi:hypothetical protein
MKKVVTLYPKLGAPNQKKIQSAVDALEKAIERKVEGEIDTTRRALNECLKEVFGVDKWFERSDPLSDLYSRAAEILKKDQIVPARMSFDDELAAIAEGETEEALNRSFQPARAV